MFLNKNLLQVTGYKFQGLPHEPTLQESKKNCEG